MRIFRCLLLLGVGARFGLAVAAEPNMEALARFHIDRTEVTIGQFRAFVRATGTLTQAERAGGGQTYEAGWEQRRGWTWAAPYGTPGADDEPAVHITQPEAQAYCRWAGKRFANCLGDCGPVKVVPHAQTSRGQGHARVGTTAVVYIGFRCVRDR